MERRVNNRTLAILPGVASATGLSAVAAWYQASAALRESHAQVIRDELQPIATRLTEDQEILEELQTEPFTEKNSGILESYLAKIRRDGGGQVRRPEAALGYTRREQHGDRQH